MNLLIMITLYFHWKSVKWIISKIETSDIFILKHLITLEKLRLLDRYFCFFWIDILTNLWNVGFFFAFTHSVDLQVDENDESKASPPLDPPPTRSPNRSPRMGRSVKARSMVIGKQINFQSYMPTIPSSQIPKSQTLPANMSTPIITVRCHGNHDLPKKKTEVFNFIVSHLLGMYFFLFITSLLYWVWFIKWDLFTFIFPL